MLSDSNSNFKVLEIFNKNRGGLKSYAQHQYYLHTAGVTGSIPVPPTTKSILSQSLTPDFIRAQKIVGTNWGRTPFVPFAPEWLSVMEGCAMSNRDAYPKDSYPDDMGKDLFRKRTLLMMFFGLVGRGLSKLAWWRKRS